MLALLSTGLSVIHQAARAQTAIDLNVSDGATVCPAAPLYGTWTNDSAVNNPDSCRSSAAILSNETLDIGAGVAFGTPGNDTLTSYGAIVNRGSFGANGFVNYGTLTSYGSCCSVHGSSISNYGTMDMAAGGGGGVFGSMVNEQGGTYTVESGAGIGIIGTFTNYGSIENAGNFNIKPAGAEGPGSPAGTFINYGTLHSTAGFGGSSGGPGDGGRVVNEPGGVITSIGTGPGQGIGMNGDFTNYGTVNSGGDLGVGPYGALNNRGTLSTSATFWLQGSFDNTGSVSNRGTIAALANATATNEAGATFDNGGAIIVYCGATFNDLGTISGNPVILPQSCQTTVTSVSSGSASANQTSTTGVQVAISGSGTSNGTTVTISSASLGTSQPNGTGTLGVDPNFYGVSVVGVNRGTARVCATNIDVTSATVMQYWNGSGWLNAVSQTVSKLSSCGTIPSSSFHAAFVVTGTPIHISTTSTASTSTTTVAIATSAMATTRTGTGPTLSQTAATTSTPSATSSSTSQGPMGYLPYLGAAAVLVVVLVAALLLQRRRS